MLHYTLPTLPKIKKKIAHLLQSNESTVPCSGESEDTNDEQIDTSNISGIPNGEKTDTKNYAQLENVTKNKVTFYDDMLVIILQFVDAKTQYKYQRISKQFKSCTDISLKHNYNLWLGISHGNVYVIEDITQYYQTKRLSFMENKQAVSNHFPIKISNLSIKGIDDPFSIEKHCQEILQKLPLQTFSKIVGLRIDNCRSKFIEYLTDLCLQNQNMFKKVKYFWIDCDSTENHAGLPLCVCVRVFVIDKHFFYLFFFLTLFCFVFATYF